MEELYVVMGIANFVSAIACVVIRNGFGSFMLGLLFGPFGVVAVAVMQSSENVVAEIRKLRRDTAPIQTVTCPVCRKPFDWTPEVEARGQCPHCKSHIKQA